MIVEGFVSYTGGERKEIVIRMDTAKKTGLSDKQADDAVSFALFGKTVFDNIIDPVNGVPLVYLSVTSGDKTIYVARQPEYIRETHFGSKYRSGEVFSVKTGIEEYPSLSSERYYQLVNGFLNTKYDDFASVCRNCVM